MKKTIGILLAVLLCLMIPLTALAEELTSCTITADSAVGEPGESVTVAVRISENSGFTNFAIALDYDHDVLTLESIETDNDGTPYLCGTQVSVNTAWNAESGKEQGYVVSASTEPVKENGIIFTATFKIAEGFVGETEIVPEVQYIRNNEAVFSAFEEITAETSNGDVTSVLLGDMSGDGIIEYDDVMLAYKAFLGETQLTPEQMAVVDTNRNGTVEETEYQAIYTRYIGG